LISRVYYKIELAYDGTHFCGWQRQLTLPTVQLCLEQSFFRVFGRNARIFAASRTDRGVHAEGQVVAVSFENFGLPASRLFKIWNDNLPETVLIKNFEEVNNSFNPQHNVVAKIYSYDLCLQKASPFLSRFGWCDPQISKVNWGAFVQYLELFVGFHNFSGFHRPDVISPKNPWRTLDGIEMCFFDQEAALFVNQQILELGEISAFRVIGEPVNAISCRMLFRAKGFLHFQIRRMVGAAFQYSLRPGKFVLSDSSEALAGRVMSSEKMPNFCVDGKGLTLRKIFYLPA
jgi:tRNA pseudouridine38-40 synthase